MSNRTTALDERLYDYLISVSLREPPILKRLRDETAADPLANMQIAPEQGQFMALLTRIMGAGRAIEVGTFTGYSSLCIALAMPVGGHIVCCDTSTEWTAMAERYWLEAGVTHMIDLRLAPALETLDGLSATEHAGQFDLAFIDADKQHYIDYYERCLHLLRAGGLILIDNTLWDGAVADPQNREDSTEAIRRCNDRVYQDTRVDLSLVPIGDGLTLARKR